jgi:hypothetical protein
MNKLLLLVLFIPLVSFGQTPYSSYYENGNLKETGPGYTEAVTQVISAKSGLNIRQSPDLKSKNIAKIPYGTIVSIISKTDLKLTIIDTDKETGITKFIEGKWIKIEAVFYLSPGDEGYHNELIDESHLVGYVFDGFIKEEKQLIEKPGIWTYYFESGVINEEVYYGWGFFKKKITYDTDGEITRIEEKKGDDDWARRITINFHKNGNVKNISVGDGGGAVYISFDENGNIIVNGWGASGGYKCIFLSKDIKDTEDENKYKECLNNIWLESLEVKP